MPPGGVLDDDYVARLLAEDAKKTSNKYAAYGLSAFLPKRRAADVPKPNTRFLSHIVREADHHNAALKRKEEEESERRLRALRDGQEPPRKRHRADESDQSKRSRMLKDILGAAQPRSSVKHRNARADVSLPSRDCPDSGKDEQKRSSRHRSRQRRRSPDSSRLLRRRESAPSTSGSESGRECQRRKRYRPTLAERSPVAHEKARNQQRRQLPDAASYNGNDNQLDRAAGNGEEAIRKRGRGAHRAKADIDDHFARSYDPSQDVSLGSDHDTEAEDWDLALEAMRDRAKWKQNQASRMREAGFDEKEISKMEKGFNDNVGNGNLSSVKWVSKGEMREWDAGKLQQ